MKLAVAGKGGVGKTSVTAWLGDYLKRHGQATWLVDADTTLSLGPALGLPFSRIPVPLSKDAALAVERAGSGGLLSLTPDVADLPERLCLDVDGLRLLVMGSVAGAGGGCACAANAVLKALLAHLFLGPDQWVLVDLEAGVEHLGRGTVAAADGLIVVSEPSLRGLTAAASIGALAAELGLTRQALVLNRCQERPSLPDLPGLPPLAAVLPVLPSLAARQLTDASVLDLPERDAIDTALFAVLAALMTATPSRSGPEGP
jgi:CO dehydrogenase maturation factor